MYLSLKHKVMFYRRNEFIIEKSDAVTLVLAERKRFYVSQVSFILLFFVIWYSIALFSVSDEKEDINVKYFFLLVPLISIYQLIPMVKMLIQGNKYIFEKGVSCFYHNKKEKARFSDITHISLRMVPGEEKSKEYLLSLSLKDRNTIFLFKSEDGKFVKEISEKISVLTSKEIIKSNV
ncbi:MAG: hypothetical protein ACJ75J_03375 [Cytophagaceae bacterium]